MDNQSTSLSKPFQIVIISILLGVLFDYFFYLKLPGVSVLIYTLIILSGLWVISSISNRPIPKSVKTLSIPALFFASMLALRSSPFLGFFNIIATMVLLLLIVSAATGKKISRFQLSNYLRLIQLPFAFLTPAFRTLADLIPKSQVSNRSRQIIKGTLISAPVLIVFITLFASADLVFANYLSQLLNINLSLSPTFIFRSLMVISITIGFIGAYSYIFRSDSDNEITSSENTRFKLGDIETTMLLGSVGILFLVFILVQLTYLFGGHTNIASLGFTYAEYARKGFFELVTVAVITLALIKSIEKSLGKTNVQHTSKFKLLASLLVTEVMIIMISAFMRLLLYEQAYGFTELRFFSHVFIMWLGVIYILLLYKIITGRSEASFVFRSAISALLVLALLNLINPDAFVARQNINHFGNTDKLDTYHLSRLSADALPETIKLLDSPNAEVRQSFARYLYHSEQIKKNHTFFDEWPSANLARAKAKQIIESSQQELEQNKNYKSPEPYTHTR